MRNALLVAISAGMIWAQQTDADRQAKLQDALQKLKELQKVQIEANARAQLSALQAQAATASSNTQHLKVILEQLRQRYTDTHPDVVRARAELQASLAEQNDLDRRMKRLQSLIDNGVPPPEPAPDTPKLALPDRWWKNPVTSQYLGLSADQQKKMDDVVQQFRGSLDQASTNLRVQETVLAPLVSADPVDEGRITAQIDRVAEARAELEKTNGRMLLGLRKLLTPEQWIKLNQAFTLSLTQK